MPENFFRTFAENSADVVCRVGTDSLLLRYASPSLTRVLGWLPDDLIGTGPEILVLDEDLPQVYEAFRQTGAIAEGPGVPTTIRMRHKDGSVVWMDISASVIPSASGGAPEIILVMRDVTARKVLEQQLAELAITDGLTGLLNRRGFDETLEGLWQRTLAAGTQLSLLLLDADHFKAFNDHYGHQVGDDCLRTIARTIRGSLQRTADRAARYGGEELAVILPGTGAEGATEIAERIRRSVAELDVPHAGNPVHRRVTVSIGIATAVARCGGSMRMPESLLLAADNALYRAKHSGRNRVERMVLLASKAS